MTNVFEFDKNKRDIKSFNFEIKTVTTETRNGQPIAIIEGLASTYAMDRGGDVILPGAFTKTLERHKAMNRPIRMKYQHWSENLIGGFPIDKVKQTDKGLEVIGEINILQGHLGEWVYSLAKQGVLADFSIGYSTVDAEYRDGIRFIKELELWEVSLVDEPMNAECAITSVKNNGDSKKVFTLEDVSEIKTIREFERCLRESGVFSKQAALHIASLAKYNQWDAGSEDDSKPKYGVDFYKKFSSDNKPN